MCDVLVTVDESAPQLFVSCCALDIDGVFMGQQVASLGDALKQILVVARSDWSRCESHQGSSVLIKSETFAVLPFTRRCKLSSPCMRQGT